MGILHTIIRKSTKTVIHKMPMHTHHMNRQTHLRPYGRLSLKQATYRNPAKYHWAIVSTGSSRRGIVSVLDLPGKGYSPSNRSSKEGSGTETTIYYVHVAVDFNLGGECGIYPPRQPIYVACSFWSELLNHFRLWYYHTTSGKTNTHLLSVARELCCSGRYGTLDFLQQDLLGLIAILCPLWLQ